MAQNSNKLNASLPEVSASIEHLLSVGCQILGAKQGVLLLFTDEYTSIVADAKNTEVLALPFLPPFDVSRYPQALCYANAPGVFSSWVKTHFGSQSFIRGQRHLVDGHHLAMLYFDPVDTLNVKSEALIVLERWLESIFNVGEEVYNPNNHRRLYEKLQSVAKIGTWEIDIVNEVLSWSTQTKLIHEVPFTFEPELATAIRFYKEGHNRDEIQRLVNHAMETGEPWRATLLLVTAKGKEVWVENHGMVEMLNGNCIRIFGTFQNVDKAVRLRLEVEASRQNAVMALKERELLLSRISHELRTPLNGITGMLQAIKVEQREHIRDRKTDFALRSADQLRQLINDVLDYTDIANGNLTLVNKPFCIQTLFHSLASEFNVLCEAKGIDFSIEYAPGDQQIIISDAARIGQMANNLLSNAVKFTTSGSVVIRIALQECSQTLERKKLLISVEDTGEGMTTATQDNLFKPLIHGDKLSSSKASGTGLGLSIVKQVVDKMGGEIRIQSTLNVGSCFTIMLPVEVEMKDEDTLSEALLAVPLSILVVDDNDINRIVLTSMLDTFNYVADEAEDGEVALHKARQKKYDIIFMDCAMPVLDGIAATKIIIEEALLADGGHVVAVTANTNEDDRKACHNAGMSAFLCKPVDKKAVGAALKRVLLQKCVEQID